MPELDPKITELEARLDSLVRTQINFQQEITTIRRELTKLRAGAGPQPTVQPPATPNKLPEGWSTADAQRPTPPITAQLPSTSDAPREEPVGSSPPMGSERETAYVPPPIFGMGSEAPEAEPASNAFSDFVSSYTESARADLEKFIGENLISKIGIIVLVLGVGIGAKYAIDNGWISPLLRIVFGYVMGFGLLGFAARLKEKYLNFSSVLLSGGMAILYFVTYFAYTYYSLMPQTLAFILMAMFTAFTVAAALFYNRQVIAHIGLVGAYAVPFLLSNNSGNYTALFTYMAIINGGILAISVKKYWKPLFYTSFGVTWIIYYTWLIAKYSPTEHFYLALTFLAIFFAIFYATQIVHGVVHSENKDHESLVSILITGFVFYGFVFAINDVKADVGHYAALFTYLALITLAILLTSFRYYGRVFIYLAYPFTWLIYGVWFLNRYDPAEHFMLAAVFACVFFSVFYIATLMYRLATDEIGMAENMALVLTNSFVFYGFGYAIMDSREDLRSFEGLFTAGHAAFHSLVAQAVNRFKASAVDVVQVLAILIITFATISIPVQFDGKIVTLVWSVEAAALFWFGRVRLIRLFEYFSYPVMLLACGSLAMDLLNVYLLRANGASSLERWPLANDEFVTTLVFVAAFAVIYWINRKTRDYAAIGEDIAGLFGLVVGTVGMLALYNMFRMEIGNYYYIQIVNAGRHQSLTTPKSIDLENLNNIWQLNYTMFFLVALCAANLRKVRSSVLAFAGIGFSGLAVLIFVTAAMVLFSELRVSYMVTERADLYVPGLINIAIRYISYVFAAALLGSLFAYTRDELLAVKVPKSSLMLGFDAIFYSTVLITASCELVNLMVQFHIPDAGKLGLSILWGVYALTLIVIGIAQNKKHLRIAAIVLLAVTLIKLFLYDIADLPTIPKTILFISLGLLMLIVSFLYNKYKGLIFKAGTDNDREASTI